MSFISHVNYSDMSGIADTIEFLSRLQLPYVDHSWYIQI